MITVRPYQSSDRDNWNSYILNNRQGTFFHLIGWKSVVEKTFGHKALYLIANRSGTSSERGSLSDHQEKITGVLPLFMIKSVIFCKALVSIPFAAYGGILADDHDSEEKLLKKAIEITETQNLDYLELRSSNGKVPYLVEKDLYVTFRKEMSNDSRYNWEAIPRKARRMIRQAEKAKLTFEFGSGEFLPEFYGIFARNYRRLGSPVFSIQLFDALLKEFRNQSNILLIRHPSGKAIAGVLTFFYGDVILPYYAGSLSEYRDFAPNDFMYWQLMQYGCQHGYKIFDFGRSKVDTGSYHFKRHWGFEPEQLPYYYYLNKIDSIPNISPVNPKYQKMIATWKKMPLWATKFLGPKIVKYIP